jgi:hypothetical protein
MRVCGVTGLLPNLHPHTDLGVATSFALLKRLLMTTELSSSLVVMGESLVLFVLCFNCKFDFNFLTLLCVYVLY